MSPKEKPKVKKINIEDTDYPENLKNIFFPPEEIFLAGNILPSDINAVAIVGTRHPTDYGLEECQKLSYGLAMSGITIISGMARGIDTAAHKGALKAGGRTIAVLGSGHHNIYPPENKRLYNEIIKNGAVISEYPPNIPPLKMNFPKRNRIISGMSKGVVVVEAPRKSGALITANFALEQGREVFAMPGNINSETSSGTNQLIKEGAKLIESIWDILEELKYLININEMENTKISSMSSEEEKIFNILDNKPKSINEISKTTNLPTYKVSELLFKLEVRKLISVLPGENFVRV